MAGASPDPDGTLHILRTLPVGIAVFDAERRAVLVNDAYCAGVGLPPGSFPPGLTLEALARAHAVRGVLGPGDPDAQARAMLAADRTKPTRLRRRRFEGRVFDLFNVPLGPSATLPKGGHAVTAVEITAFVEQRDDAHAALFQVREAIATLALGVSVFAEGGVLVLSNPAFAALLGLDASGIAPGMRLSDLVTRMAAADAFADDDEGGFLARQRTQDRGQPWTARRVRSDGRVIDIASGPLPGRGFTITVGDVTSLVRAEDESRRRAETLSGVLHALPVGVLVWDASDRLTMRNEAYVSIFGDDAMPLGGSVAETLERRLCSGEIDAAYVARLRAMGPGQRLDQRVRPNGTRLDVRRAPLADNGFVAVFNDVTKLAQAEEAARLRTETLHAMLRHIRHGITLWDRDFRLVAHNEAAVRLLGNHPDVVRPGAHIRDVLEQLFARGEYGQGETARLWRERLSSQDKASSTVYQRVSPAGRVLEVRYDPTPDGGFVVTLTDITDIREAEAATLRAKEAAETASRAKSHFLAAMSGELRAPLKAIIERTEALAPSAAAVEGRATDDAAAALRCAGQRLQTVIDVILDVARMETGGLELAEGPVDFATLARAAAAAAQAAAGGVRIACEGVALPPVRGDGARLRDAIGTLLQAAIDSSDAGDTVTLTTSLNAAGRCVLAIDDRGTPIEPDDMPGLFELPRLDRPAGARAARMGLGLYAARALLQAQGGDLLLKSDAIMGTSVVLWLPRAHLGSPTAAGGGRAGTPLTGPEGRD